MIPPTTLLGSRYIEENEENLPDIGVRTTPGIFDESLKFYLCQINLGKKH